MLLATRQSRRLQETWYFPNPEADAHRRRHLLAVLFGATVCLVTAAAIGTVIWDGTSKEIDARGCIEGLQPAHAILGLIDQSDTFSTQQLTLVTNTLQRRVRDLGFGDLVSLLKLQRNEDGKPMTEVFNRCQPKQGKYVNRWWDNKRMRDDTYQAEFAAPLKAALDSTLVPGAADESPLIEALHSISQRPVFDAGGQGRTLILFSDGLQHTDLVSFFKRSYSFERLEERNSIYLSGLREHFSGACVEMYIVSTHFPRQIQWPEFETFWRSYWKAAGVDCLIFNKI